MLGPHSVCRDLTILAPQLSRWLLTMINPEPYARACYNHAAFLHSLAFPSIFLGLLLFSLSLLKTHGQITSLLASSSTCRNHIHLLLRSPGSSPSIHQILVLSKSHPRFFFFLDSLYQIVVPISSLVKAHPIWYSTPRYFLYSYTHMTRPVHSAHPSHLTRPHPDGSSSLRCIS